MEIIERKGDLVKAFLAGDFEIIAHQANCFCTAKTGLAPQIFKALPWLKRADAGTHYGDRRKLGNISYSESKNKVGFNLYGQYHHDHDDPEYGTRYWALYSALKQMRIVLNSYRYPPSVGFPRLGCGVGGGNWAIVKSLIEMVFGDYPGNIYVYTLP